MNELTIRMTGQVVESNFEQWRESILAIIDGSARDLVTDDDFSWAENTVKEFKGYEVAIKAAKDKALSETADIATMISAVDEISSQLAKTRLHLEKQIKTEKEVRKNRLIADAEEKAYSEIKNSLPVATFFGCHDIDLNSSAIKGAVVGKKTLDGMRKALECVVKEEVASKLISIAAANENMATILDTEKEFPGLFYDKKNLAWKTTEEVAAIIDARVAQFRLQQKEKEERELAKERERSAKTDDNTDCEEEQKQGPQSAINLQQPHSLNPQQSHKDIHTHQNHEITKDEFVFTVRLRCDVSTARTLAREISSKFDGNPAVIEFRLTEA